MSLTRYNWALSPSVRDGFRQAFDAFSKLSQDEDSDPSSVVTSQWAPRVDIKEESNRFVIFTDVPGVDPRDIEISMDKGILSIKGERVVENKEETDRYTRLERSRGTFYRRFALPDSADADGIKASGKHGVLEIVIPKRPETTPRRITIE